jgi:hypothetical protein
MTEAKKKHRITKNEIKTHETILGEWNRGEENQLSYNMLLNSG